MINYILLRWCQYFLTRFITINYFLNLFIFLMNLSFINFKIKNYFLY